MDLETFQHLFRRLGTGADNPLQVIVELLLIGISVNWCAGVLHGTRGTRLLRGLLVLFVVATLGVQLLAATQGWARLELLYRFFVIGLAFIALVAFQPELRRALIRAGDVRFRWRFSPRDKLIAALTETAGYLSRHKYGGLIAIQREIGLANWAENGTQINAEVSANLLKSIFYPNGALHDLGVVIRDNRLIAANCQFPVAESGEVEASLGSRHRAAVGISAESDALVLVVSDETGTISLADHGKLTRFLSLDDLEEQLQERLSGTRMARRRRKVRSVSDLWRYVRRFLVVAPLTLVIWFLADQASLVRRDGIPIELELIHDSSIHVDVSEPNPTGFRLGVRGTTSAVEDLLGATSDGPLQLRWTIHSPYDHPGEYSPSGPDLLEILQGLPELKPFGVMVEEATPSALSFEVNAVAVLDNVAVQVDGGAYRIEVVEVTPPSVRVRYLRKEGAALDPSSAAVHVDVADQLTQVAPGQTRTLTDVRLPRRAGAVPLLDVEPPTVAITVRVVSETSRVRLEQVAVSYLLSPQVAERTSIERQDVNEWLVELEVEGDRAVVGALDASDVRAYVRIGSEQAVISPDYRSFEVEVELPSGVKLVGPPPTVHLRFQSKNGVTP